jgi:tetratricopeptide (TPR) repeat protein
MSEAPRPPRRSPGKKKAKAAPARKKAAATPPPPRTQVPPVIPVDLTDGVEEALRKLREQASGWINKGRYTKVRFRFRGKQLLPDLPLGAVVAAEAATFAWTGVLRALVFNLVGKSVIDVELINEADLEVAKGREHLLGGDLEAAEAALDRALEMDREHAGAHLNRGIVLKLRGRKKDAAKAFARAVELDPEGETGRDARKQLEALGPVTA